SSWLTPPTQPPPGPRGGRRAREWRHATRLSRCLQTCREALPGLAGCDLRLERGRSCTARRAPLLFGGFAVQCFERGCDALGARSFVSLAEVPLRAFALPALPWRPSMATRAAPQRASFLPSRGQGRQTGRRGGKVFVRPSALVLGSGRSFCNRHSQATLRCVACSRRRLEGRRARKPERERCQRSPGAKRGGT